MRSSSQGSLGTPGSQSFLFMLLVRLSSTKIITGSDFRKSVCKTLYGNFQAEGLYLLACLFKWQKVNSS